MRLTQIRDFLAVVECSGVRAAARKLGVAQPTVSNSVRELEAELHVQLLGRSSRGVALTPAGRAFHARAQLAATELRKTSEEAVQTGGSAAGTVTFSMGRVGVATVLPEAIARFRHQYPLARIRVIEGYGAPVLADVRNGRSILPSSKSPSRHWMLQSGFARSFALRLRSVRVKDIPLSARAPWPNLRAPIG